MNVLEELTEERVDRAYVERRIEDWKARIADVYANVKAWLPLGWSAREEGDVPMREELMQRFDMPEARLPLLQMEAEDGRRGRLEPRGLWIIGANGRIDLILPSQHYLIVNREDSFETPNWQVASIDARREQKPLSRELIRGLLN